VAPDAVGQSGGADLQCFGSPTVTLTAFVNDPQSGVASVRLTYEWDAPVPGGPVTVGMGSVGGDQYEGTVGPIPANRANVNGGTVIATVEAVNGDGFGNRQTVTFTLLGCQFSIG
jgi:hypothetical protein